MKLELRLDGKIVTIVGDFTIAIQDDVAVVVADDVAVPEPVGAIPADVPAVIPKPVVDIPTDVLPLQVVNEVVYDTPISPIDEALFRKLSSLRRELAIAAKVPPYVIFHDKTLREMIHKRPNDLWELSEVSGVGQSKLDKYGEKFLSIIRGA